MQFELKKGISILERTPKVLQALLGGLSDEWTSNNEGDNTWSPFDIVGHLIHGEKTDWTVRAEIIIGSEPNKKFKPFDRFAQFENSKGKSLKDLLNEFEALRVENLKKLKSLDISDKTYQLEGMHPELGVVNLKQLLSTWVVHDLGHIHQIARVMAKQYGAEVGPWVEYMRVLNK